MFACLTFSVPNVARWVQVVKASPSNIKFPIDRVMSAVFLGKSQFMTVLLVS